ncbi:MAG TPA: 2-oxo-3-hexenedioate decarboxylase [Castellaniella sp.]|nr:2-oxo-3-hexenedioate decarboxylase [Castellaniella sp.]
MSLAPDIIRELAERLETCELQAQDTLKITLDHPEMGWDDAYAIQDEIRRRKLARGARIVGLKAGLTSFAKMRQMGVETPIFGFLADGFLVPDGGQCRHAELIHPKVEPEIVFVTKAPLAGPGCTIAEVLAATDFVLAGIEVIDSRYRDFKFDLKSVVADNCSSSRFVVGGVMREPGSLDLRTTGVVMEKNGRIVSVGAGAAVLGHPANAVAMLANHLGRRGESIPAGALILTGGITEAVAVEPGDHVALHMQGMSCTSLTFV